MSDRAGYSVAFYVIDVSRSMAEHKADPAGTGKVPKLHLAKEFVARMCESKVLTSRKTDHIGVVSFGGRSNNEAIVQGVDESSSPYRHVSSDVAIQTAKPKTIETIVNLDVGEHEGNPISALMIALDMIQGHKHTHTWTVELTLVTDGESSFSQDEYEELIERLLTIDAPRTKLNVVGIDFNPLSEPVDKSKSRNKRLAEKFWRVFTATFNDTLATLDTPAPLSSVETFDDLLIEARRPHISVVNGTVSGIHLSIGSLELNADEAIIIPIKFSKATMKARPTPMSKAWKPAMDLQVPLRAQNQSTAPNPLISGLMNHSSEGSFNPGEMASLISADVKQHSTYVISKGEPAPPRATQDEDATQIEKDTSDHEEEQEEYVEQEDLVKAWRFGSTWVPVESDVFEPLGTQKGVEVLGFIPIANIKRDHLMGEVRYIWPDLTSPKAQIKFSALVQAMELRKVCACVRWVLKDQAEPTIGACFPAVKRQGDQILDYMYQIKLPFAEDDHPFCFPSLSTIKTKSGKILTEHPLLPTKEQCDLMDDLVLGMDLDEYARKKQNEAAGDDTGDADKMMENGDEQDLKPWFSSSESVNPAIHRIKEAIFHAALASDLDKEPLGPPHPELSKYFNTPHEVVEKTQDVADKLKQALDIKKVPPKRIRKKAQSDELGEDEGYIDEDALFADPSKVKAAPSQTVKSELGPISQSNVAPKPGSQSSPAGKPKPGRIISNDFPLDDFNRVIRGEGDVFRKAIQDVGAVAIENVESSFGKSKFKQVIECLKVAREVALSYEEVETYNSIIDDLEKTVLAKGFKHPNFWEHFEQAGKDISKISDEEAEAAVN